MLGKSLIMSDSIKHTKAVKKFKSLDVRKVPISKITPTQRILLEILEREHLSLCELSKKINLPQVTIQKLLSGITKDPHIKTFNKIFKIYIHSLVCKEKLRN